MSILLCTLNARYSHASFGLRYLRANMAELRDQTQILEFTLQQDPEAIVQKIGERQPRIVGFGIYIWNTSQTLKVIQILKSRHPEITVVLGGPEISFETEGQELTQVADYVIGGESDFLFRDFCHSFLAGTLPPQKIIRGELPSIQQIALPYSEYTDEDIKNRVLYVEASRGCPYKCEYCLSSLDKSVRNFEINGFLGEMQKLIDRGARQFKFVDRTFNLSPRISSQILNFFLERIDLGLFLHFEMVPDRLPEDLRALIQKFPSGSLQFEVGIQTWNPSVAALVSRRQDYKKIIENFTFLNTTGVHTHTDLIVGLPGEDLESFGKGFDEVAKLGAHEIQVGILKRLKGTPITRHDFEWKMLYSKDQPFQILSTRLMDATTISRMVRFAKFWDLYSNSGNFKRSMGLLREHIGEKSWFWGFHEFVVSLESIYEKTHSISLESLAESLHRYLITQLSLDTSTVDAAILADFTRGGTRTIPKFLRIFGTPIPKPKQAASVSAAPARQQRHLN